MCGRNTITGGAARYGDYFEVDEIRTPPLQPSFIVAPTDSVYVVARHQDSRQLGSARWGLLPFWARDRGSGQINAGIRSRWRDPLVPARITTCAIITGSPNPIVAPFHDRMPVILPPDRGAPGSIRPWTTKRLLRPCSSRCLPSR